MLLHLLLLLIFQFESSLHLIHWKRLESIKGNLYYFSPLGIALFFLNLFSIENRQANIVLTNLIVDKTSTGQFKDTSC